MSTNDRRRQTLELGALTLLAAPLRLLALDRHPLWLDEANSVLVTRGGPGGVIDALSVDGNPPLFYWLLWAWTRLFGDSEIAVRALPALIGVAAVLVIHRVTAALFPARRWAPLLAGLLFATSPLMVYYARECRMYSLTPLIGALGAWTLLEGLRRGSRRHLAGHAGLLAAGLYTHNFFLFVLPIPVVAALVVSGPVPRRMALLRAAACVGGAVLLYAPWAPILADQAASGVGAFIAPLWEVTPPHLALVRSFEVMGVGAAYPPYLLKELSDLHLTIPNDALWLLLRWVGAGLTLGVLGLAFTRLRTERDAVAVCGLYLLLPLLLPWLASFVLTPVYLVGRYELIAAFAFAVLGARALDRLLEWRALAFASVLVVWLGAAGVAFTGMAKNEPLVLERVTADWLKTFVNAKDAVVFCDYTRAVPEYYLGHWGVDVVRHSFPAAVGEHPGWYDTERTLDDFAEHRREAWELAARLRTVLDRGGRVFLVDYTHGAVGLAALNRPLYEALGRTLGRGVPAWAPIAGRGPVIVAYGVRRRPAPATRSR